MTRLSVGLLSSASYLSCPFRKDPRTLKRGSLGTGGRRVATKPTPSPSASSNWAVLSLLPPLPCHVVATFSSLLFCLYSSVDPFSLASFTSLSLFLSRLPLSFHLASTAIHLRRVLPEILFSAPNPFSTGSRSLFFLFLSRLCLYLPSSCSRQRFASSREDSFFRRYTLPSARQPPASTPRLVYGNVATWFVVVTAIVGDRVFLRRERVVTSGSSICEKIFARNTWTRMMARELLFSLFLSLFLAFGIMSWAASWWFIEKVFRIFWGIVRVWLGIGSNYYAYSFIRCFEWYSQLDENNLSNLK